MAAPEYQLVRAETPGLLTGELARASGAAMRIELLPPRAVLNLRGPAAETFARGVEEVFGVAPPLEPNRWAGGGDRAAAWLGPDEWLLVVSGGDARDIERALRKAFAEEPWFSVTDVSHNYTALRLSGPRARELLAKGCALDLHASVFGAGACAQTLLARARVTLRALDGSIELWVRNSFAGYAAMWLLDAAAEFQREGTS